MHKWFCQHCKRYILGETCSHLARNVNEHNVKYHPGDFCKWKAEEIAVSNNYDGFDANPPAYLRVPIPVPSVPVEKIVLTKEDRKFLKEAKVSWD